MPAGNSALANDLYGTLTWQLVLLVTASAVIGWLLWARRSPARGSGDLPTEPRGRRILRISLGVLWVVDGLLQAQPQMPSSFVSVTIAPRLVATPEWLQALVTPFTRLWLQHPVGADTVTVWIQVGLGLAIIVGGTGRVARLVLLASCGWAAFVWVVGELLGGLTEADSSWLTGAPGSALLYVVAAVLLMLPLAMWRTGVAARWARLLVGVCLLVGAGLQALPRTGFWGPGGLSGALSDTAAMGVPEPLAVPVRWLAGAVPSVAVLANGALVLVLVVLGSGLLVGRWTRTVSAATAVLTLLSWWFGQGFGIFGGTGTDPDTGMMLLVLLAAGWPWPSAPVTESSALIPELKPQPVARWRPVLRIGAVAVAVGTLLVLPLAASFMLLGPQTAQAAVGDSGGVVRTDPVAMPQLTLTDQTGRSLSTQQLRGKLVVVAFLDPECYDTCPLIANQLRAAVGGLGADSDAVAVYAIDVNPYFNSIEDVRTFTHEHGLDDMTQWHFVTGSNAAVGAALSAFGQGVSVPPVGMIGHPQAVYLFGRGGEELAVLNDTGNEELTQSYAQLIESELRHFL